MLPEFEIAIVSMMERDKTIPAASRRAVLAILRGEQVEVKEDSILTRSEAAKKLRVSPVTVTTWARKGIIRRVSVPGRRKAVGYSAKSVFAIINGGSDNV